MIWHLLKLACKAYFWLIVACVVCMAVTSIPYWPHLIAVFRSKEKPHG